MWRRVATITLLGVVVGCGPSASSRTGDAGGLVPSEAARRTVARWRADLDTLGQSITQLDAASRQLGASGSADSVRRLFRIVRHQFKRVELAMEYYAPSTARQFNGPPIPEAEAEEGPNVITPPQGLQVLETLLSAPDAEIDRDAVLTETGTLVALANRVRTKFAAQEASDAHIWDAARLEIARVMVLGLAGFDVPDPDESRREVSSALTGVERTLTAYRRDTPAWRALDARFADAHAALVAEAPTEGFDYLGFIARVGHPLAGALVAARNEASIGTPVETRGFRMEAASIFDADAFDVLAFAPPGTVAPTAQQVALGRRLFTDRRLSVGRDRSCESCHLPGLAFTDGRPRALVQGAASRSRNTPTVINSGLQVGNFADLRTTFLEDQVTDVVENPAEMHGSLDVVSRVLMADTTLAAEFRQAFANSSSADSTVTPARIRLALAAYMRSLTALNSPVDRALRGDTAALSPEARRGFNVYMGKGRCASCHFLPLTHGTVPPMYQRSEVEVIGVPADRGTRPKGLDADLGRFHVTKSDIHRHAFRTQSLRNVALTAPYMHNGVYATLEEVVEFYDRGGGLGMGLDVPNQTLPADRLNLTSTEKQALVAFMRAMTDTSTTSPRR
jgi:cytochrome c peroxidase